MMGNVKHDVSFRLVVCHQLKVGINNRLLNSAAVNQRPYAEKSAERNGLFGQNVLTLCEIGVFKSSIHVG